MRITLVHLPYQFLYGALADIAGVWPPLGLLYVASALQMRGHGVRIFDGNAEGWSLERLAEEIMRSKPDCVGLTLNTTLLTQGRSLIEKLRMSHSLKVPIVVGGPHPTSDPETLLREIGADIVVRGEGELTMPEVVSWIERGGSLGSLQEIAGVSFLLDGVMVNAPDRPYIENLDEMPSPAYELVNMSRYRARAYWSNGKPWFTVSNTRGCPYRCIYCNAPDMQGRRVRKRTASRLVEEIVELRARFGIGNIFFTDSVFTFDREYTMEVCRLMAERNLGVEWVCETRVDLVDDELLRAMKRAGCAIVAYGIESANEDIRRRLRKGIKGGNETIEKAVHLARKNGIQVHSYWIVGSPGETWETARESIDLAKRLNTDMAIFSSMTPYPGTQVYQVAKAMGQVTGAWDRYFAGMAEEPPVFKSDGIEAEEIQRIVRIAHREYYFRLGYVLSQLANVRNYRRIFRMLSGVLALRKILRPKKGVERSIATTTAAS